jgi:hypothetical protein
MPALTARKRPFLAPQAVAQREARSDKEMTSRSGAR